VSRSLDMYVAILSYTVNDSLRTNRVAEDTSYFERERDRLIADISEVCCVFVAYCIS
jgi:hypothetical protein